MHEKYNLVLIKILLINMCSKGFKTFTMLCKYDKIKRS